MKQNQLLVFAFLTCISANVKAEISTEILCFSSGDGSKNPVHFEMRTYVDATNKWAGGYVRYDKSNKNIPIVLNSRLASSEKNYNQPEYVSTWLEITGNMVSGKYELDSQGATINSATYISYKKNKMYTFILDSGVETSVLKGCQW